MKVTYHLPEPPAEAQIREGYVFAGYSYRMHNRRVWVERTEWGFLLKSKRLLSREEAAQVMPAELNRWRVLNGRVLTSTLPITHESMLCLHMMLMECTVEAEGDKINTYPLAVPV